jgi:hypothetical protein
VDDHALAVDIFYFQLTYLSTAQPGRIGGHQQSSVKQIPCRVEESNHFLWCQDDRQAARCLWIGHLLDGVLSLQCFAEEEAQSSSVYRYRTRAELALRKQIRLISADLVSSKLVGWAVIMFRKGFHNPQVAFHGSLRVITTLEFLQHYFA